MDKTYQPHAIETSWYNTWESENYFAPQGAGDSYTIMRDRHHDRAALQSSIFQLRQTSADSRSMLPDGRS